MENETRKEPSLFTSLPHIVAPDCNHQFQASAKSERNRVLLISPSFIFYFPSTMNNSSSSSSDVHEFLIMNKRKYVTSSEDYSRRGRRRFKKEVDQGRSRSKVSTSLKLYEDPWKIKKRLTQSDLQGSQSRLLLPGYLVKKQILPLLGGEDARAVESDLGRLVRIWDTDTRSMHQLRMKRWSSSKSHVLIGKWNQDFVKRRKLNKGDEIGLYWDPYTSLFHFCVLKRANPSYHGWMQIVAKRNQCRWQLKGELLEDHSETHARKIWQNH